MDSPVRRFVSVPAFPGSDYIRAFLSSYKTPLNIKICGIVLVSVKYRGERFAFFNEGT